jgi:hypothetical protein
VFGVIFKTSVDFVTKVYQLTGHWDRDKFCGAEEEILHTVIMLKGKFSISIFTSTAS